jgi:glutamate-1-semialdehyde 2,1-aminomutase
LQSIIELCRAHGIVSIFDEVITGFRLALGGAREYFGLAPDLSIYGKAIAGGFSLSAVGGRAAIFDALRDGRTFHAGTYNGNAICLAAARATLEILSSPGVFDAMRAHGRKLRSALEDNAKRYRIPMVTCGAETVFSVHFGLETPPGNYGETRKAWTEHCRKFQLAMLDNGVYLLPDGRWYVGARHDEAALHTATQAMDDSMKRLTDLSPAI